MRDRRAVLFGQDLTLASADPAGLTRLKISIDWKGPPLALAGAGILVSRRIYDERVRAGLTDADPVELQYTERPVAFVLVGVVDLANDSPMAPFADTMLVTNAMAAAKLLQRPGQGGGDRVSRIDLYLDKGADLGAVRDGSRKSSARGPRFAPPRKTASPPRK